MSGEFGPLDTLDLEDKINILLTFAVEQCSLGDHFHMSVHWNSPRAKKDITLLWDLKEEPDSTTDPSVRREERWRLLERYFQPKYSVTLVGNFPSYLELVIE